MLFAAGQKFKLNEFKRVIVLGAGKAAAPMALAVSEILGPYLAGGMIVTKYGHSLPALSRTPVRQSEAGHPLPDERGVQATHQIIDLARTASESDLVICLISGGGSALLTAPVPQIGLQGLSALTEQLLASGADIHEFNTVRKHLSLVKGGRLAELAAPAALLSLYLSDVPGDDLAVIASGPTVPDPTTFRDAADVLEKYSLAPPGHILDGLAGTVPETPKPGDPAFRRATNLLIGSNRLAVQAALSEAQRRGLDTQKVPFSLAGEARQAGTRLAEQLAGMPPGACWVAGGETTVTLGPNPGQGGRNLETALAAAVRLSGAHGRMLITLATDGGDGPTDAAGAVVSGETLARARALEMDPDDYLTRHDAYPFFDELGDLIKTGPTRTNVNDLAFLFSFGAGETG